MFYDIDICDIASYADDNTPYISDLNLEEVIQKLQLTTNNLFERFRNSHMKVNVDVKIDRFFGVKIDSKLSFKYHVSSFCKKLHTLRRVVNFMDLANNPG